MAQAIRVHEHGGPEVLSFDEVEIGEPGPGEARLRQTAIGLNFIDVYFRTGLYKAPAPLPFIPGGEGVGIVEAVGPGVDFLEPGMRVGYATTSGAYAEQRLMPADRLVPLPDSISDRQAASILLKGMTARYLLRQTYVVGPQTTMLLHAAAGGVGSIVAQWASALGATIIGTAGSAEKVELARSLGCRHMINYREEDFVARVREITDGRKVDVVYDSVGHDTFPGSLDCLKPRGLWVSFGNSSGSVPAFEISILNQKGSLYATRPSLFVHVSTRADLLENTNDLFAAVEKGWITIPEPQTYPLAEAGRAQADLEARRTTGSVVLIP